MNFLINFLINLQSSKNMTAANFYGIFLDYYKIFSMMRQRIITIEYNSSYHTLKASHKISDNK